MADNVTLPGAGASIATDDVGGTQFQRVKLDGGSDGATMPLVASQRIPDNEVAALPVRPVGQEVWNVSFSDVGASVIAPEFTQPTTGTGVSFAQASGALGIVTGTTPRAEFLSRSVRSWRGSLRLRFSTVLSQRIANTNFAILLADLLRENASVTINSATAITVDWAGHTFTAQSVGQSINVGGIVGAAGVPGRYAIASVIPGVSFTLAVSGWPASGSCTATLFGHSYIRNLFTGTSATAVAVDAQRNGWASGDTVAACNSTAGVGTILQNEIAGREVYWADTLRASSGTPNVTTRASRFESIPDDNLDLHVFLWAFNGTTAPASSTTWTISFCAIEKYANLPVYLQGQRAQGSQNALSVVPLGTVATSGSVSGTATHDTAITGGPVRIGGRAVSADYTAVGSGDAADLICTRVGAQIVKPYAIPETEWGASLALTATAAVAVQAAAAAGLKRHMTGFWAINTGAATVDLILLDGATERVRYPLPVNVPVALTFPTGLVLTAATALNAALSAAGTVRLNAHGYTAP